MKIDLANRVQRIKPSPTLSVTAKAAELRAAGQNVIGLGAGEPDFDTPEHIKSAAIDAIRSGFTKYTAVDGTAGLKQAIVQKFEQDNQLQYAAEQILVSCGGKQSFYNLCQALLDEGDEVIIPAPYWVSYPDMVLLANAKPVTVFAGQDQQFKITAEQLEASITAKTRLLVLNSPSNPTGAVYSKSELQALGKVLSRHPQVLIASDDMYEHILWDTAPFTNIVMACPELYERSIVLNGVSKAYSMTGWRIGYAAGPVDLIRAMKKIQSQSTSNPCSISQVAAQTALLGDQNCISQMVEAFQDRHEYVVGALNQLHGVECLPGLGAFYSFPTFEKAIAQLDGIDDDVALTEAILSEVNVALVPGSAFGAPGYARLSFATSMENLQAAMSRLETFFNRD